MIKNEQDAEFLSSDSLYWLRRYSDKGDARASYVCGRLYYSGAGVEKNDLLADRYLKRCVAVSSDAQYWLGMLHSDVHSRVCNMETGCAWLRKSYNAGSKEAASVVGDLCLQLAVADASTSKLVLAYGGKRSLGVEASLALPESERIHGVDGALSAAAQWYRIGSEKDDSYSTFKYGVCLIQGLGCECDVDRGLSYVAKATSMGCAEAAIYIAIRHWCTPSGLKGERETVLRHLRYANCLGDGRAKALLEQFEQGYVRPRILDDDDELMLSHWPMGVCNSGIHSCDMLRKNVDALLERAENGVAVAMFKAGCKLYNGFMDEDIYGYSDVEVAADSTRARSLFERAAILGYVPAITMLGVIQEKRNGFDRGGSVASCYYRLASRMGDGYASWRLYKQRMTAISDGKISFNALHEGKDAIDNWNIGYFYEKGLHVGQDYEKAEYYYTEAASRGFTPAMVSLGRILAAGWTGDSNYIRAYALFSEAACRGDVGGMYFLGKCYEFGIGCEIDIATAYMLYVESARQGNASAKLRAAKISLNHKGDLDEFGEARYTLNAVVADAVALPHLFFLRFSVHYTRNSIGKKHCVNYRR